MARHRIFISATSRDLGSYRELASKTLRGRGYETDDQPIFNLTHLEITTKLETRIAACDAVVCLIGLVYGGEPKDRPTTEPRRSYTQLEYDIARRLNKPVFRLFADTSTEFDPHQRETEDLLKLQLDYIAEVKRNHDWRTFANKDQLRAEIAELRFPWEGPPPDHKPNNLPFATIGTLFKGRESFLANLRDHLATPDGKAAAIVARQAVHGLGGVGKTRTAIEYGWRHAGDYTALLFISAPTASALRSNLAELAGVLAVQAGPAVEQRLAEVLHWLDAHPGWLLILDNVDTEDAAREAETLLARLNAGHVLITSRLSNWGAGVEPLELHVLAEADAVAFLLERARNRRKSNDDAASARTISHELDGLALALEQAGAYIDKLRLTFAEYLARWQAKRPEVLGWHDQRLMKYPASVAVTWLTTFAQLSEPERLLLGILSYLAPEPIPLGLFDTKPMTAAIDEPRDHLAGLAGYSLVRFEGSDAVLVHRLVQETGRQKDKGSEALRIALEAVNALVPFDPDDVRTWPVWTPLAPHALAVAHRSDAAGITDPTARLMNQLGLYLRMRSQHDEAERLYRRSLAIDERSYGPDHPNVARHLNNLASLLQATNRLGEAEPMMRRALAIDERSYGLDHPNVAIDLNSLAGLLRVTNRLSEAVSLHRRALAIDERSYGPDHPLVANRPQQPGEPALHRSAG